MTTRFYRYGQFRNPVDDGMRRFALAIDESYDEDGVRTRRIGVAVCIPHDEYNRRIGRRIAEGRLERFDDRSEALGMSARHEANGAVVVRDKSGRPIAVASGPRERTDPSISSLMAHAVAHLVSRERLADGVTRWWRDTEAGLAWGELEERNIPALLDRELAFSAES